MLQTATDYPVQDASWFPASVIIDEFERTRRIYGNALETDPLFKSAREMFVAAIACLGAYELNSQNQFYLQKYTLGGSPDVMTGILSSRPTGGNLMSLNQLEITEMEAHYKSDDVVQFLLDTKLSPKKAYNEYMMIICMINRIAPVNYKEIHDKLKVIAPKSTIYLVGRLIEALMGTFIIATPYPDLVGPITFNINDTVAKFSLKPRLDLTLGTKDELIEITNAKPMNVFDMFGLDQKKIEAKYRR